MCFGETYSQADLRISWECGPQIRLLVLLKRLGSVTFRLSQSSHGINATEDWFYKELKVALTSSRATLYLIKLSLQIPP